MMSIPGVNRHFQAKHANYSNFRIIKTTEAILTKFCTMIGKTANYSLWSSQNLLYKANGRRPPSQPQLIWPILMKFCTLMHIGPPDSNGSLKNKISKIQDSAAIAHTHGCINWKAFTIYYMCVGLYGGPSAPSFTEIKPRTPRRHFVNLSSGS